MSDYLLPPSGESSSPRLTGAVTSEPLHPRKVRGDGAIQTDMRLMDYVKVLHRRRWAAGTAFAVVFLSAIVYTFTATPIYEAHAQLLIEAENPNVVSFKEVLDPEKATNDYYQTQYRILQSRTLARRTLDQLKFWNLFDAPAARPRVTLRSIVGMPVTYVARLFSSPPPAEAPGADETAAQSRAIDAFLQNLTIAPIRNSRLVDVRYESTNPQLAAQVANALSHAYIEQSLDYKFTASKEASDWLGARLSEQRKQVEGSEAALQRYREQNDALSLEERQNIVVQKLAELSSAVTRAKTERIQKQAAYEQVAAIQSDRATADSVPAILSNQYVQQQKNELAELQRQQAQLSEKLGDNHPDMVKIRLAIQMVESRIQGEVTKIVQGMKNDYQAASAQEQSLTQALEQQKKDALALNRKGIDYGVLERDAASNREIFGALMQRTKETGISGELKTSNIRIVDEAEVPRAPASPNKSANLLIGLLAGSFLATGLAFVFEFVDSRIKSPAEIKNELGLAFLGMIPAVSIAESGPNPLLTNGVKPGFAEAIRIVRTNVLFSSAGEGGRSLVVTSTGPGEGKTLVASNLAVALSQTRQRVLLIDGDMRRPRVHEVFDAPQEPGLSNVLVGDTKMSDAIRQTSIDGLWLLPSGHIPPNPAELLGSKSFQDMITNLTKHFAWVVIDSPPVMAVTDAPIVAHIAQGCVFVVGAEMTGIDVARTAVEQLADAGGHLIGAVLNRVDLDNNGYYYSQYYRREYGAYYTKNAVA